jgi:Signal recognition particle 14kD protein
LPLAFSACSFVSNLSVRMLLEPTEFLARLADLYSSHENTGTVRLQFKRYVKPARKGDQEQKPGPVCLVRASDGKNTISAQVSKDTSADFQNKLGALLRSQLAACVKSEV